MQSLKFKQLLLISDSTKSANQFDFPNNLTIITADDNNYGKSTLGKLLYWSFGCDPDFDTKWLNLDCRALVKFSIGESQYEVMRYKSMISLNIEGEITTYPKVTGDYGSKIGTILGFHALMPKRDTVTLETPPPAYFFVPFYIDQKKSWASAWEGFGSLGQYKNWKTTIIKYHIGLLPKEHFDLELSKSLKQQEKVVVDEAIKKINVTLEIVSQYISDSATTIDKDRLEKITVEIREDLKELSEFQEKTLDEFTKLEGERSFLLHQKTISERIIEDLEKDYKFAVTHFIEDSIECPLCGTQHENSIISRASIMTDKQQAEMQFTEIQMALVDADAKLITVKKKLDKTRSDIDSIHAKYLINEDEQQISLNEIIENIAGNSIRENVKTAQAQKLFLSKSLEEDINQIANDQKNLLSIDQKDNINNLFLTTFSSYIEALDAEDINTSSVTSPMDYNKIIKEGGAAEGSRGILAYYLTIHTMIEQSGNDVIAPILIDTPNQQEQSVTNYDKILKLIKKKVSANSQVILCALQNEKLDSISEDAHIIHLTEKKLLDESKYEAVKAAFEIYKLDKFEDNI